MEAFAPFTNVVRQLELWLKSSEWGRSKYPQKPSIGPHLKEYSRSRPPLFLFPAPFLPRRDSPRRVPTPNQHLLGLHPTLWSIAIPTPSESARLSPGLSRLGQYRKRLTCTLTRIHVEPRVRHLSINTLRYSDGHWPVTQTVYRYWNAVCHQSAFDYGCSRQRESVLLSCLLEQSKCMQRKGVY